MRSALTLVVLSLLALPALGTDADRSYTLGRTAMRDGNIEKAVALFESAVQLNPASAEYHFWLGNAYGNQAQKANPFKQAMLARKTRTEFEKAVELDPGFLDARFGLIDFYMIAPGFMGGDDAKAQEQAREIRKRDPQAGHRAWARIYLREKKIDLARKEYVDAVRERPSSAKAHYYLAVFYIGADKNYKSATEELETAIRLDPAFMSSYFRLGQNAAMWGNNFSRGEEALRKYLQHKPDTDDPPIARAWYWLGTIQEKSGRKAEAKQSFQTVLRLSPADKDAAAALKRLS